MTTLQLFKGGQFVEVEHPLARYKNGKDWETLWQELGYITEDECYGVVGETTSVVVHRRKDDSKAKYPYIVSYGAWFTTTDIAVETFGDFVALMQILIPIVQTSLQTSEFEYACENRHAVKRRKRK
jgi:hypothetical protein